MRLSWKILLEEKTFTAFLNADPFFAGDKIVDWKQPNEDPPDVLCTTEGGLQVGVELTGWLDNGQITEAKAEEAIEQSIRKAICPEPPNNTEHSFRLAADAAEGACQAKGRGRVPLGVADAGRRG